MKRTIAIFFSIFVGTLAGIAQPMTDIRIVSEDQRSVVLEFTPHIQAEHVSGNQGTIFTRFRFFESQITYDSTGRADFIRAVILLLPSPQYSLQVLTSEYQIKDTVKLLPQPTINALKDFGVVESYDDTSFTRTTLAPGQNVLAELVRVGQTSIGCVGTLLLHPVHAVDKEKVKIFSRIVVRLNFMNAFPAGLVSSCLLRGNLPQKTLLAKMAKVSSRQSANEDSPLAQGEWYRIEVTDAGMYKLDYNYFHSLNIPISDINSIRLYGNGGLAIPDNNDTINFPRPKTLLEIPRLVVDQNNNGIFDADDYVVFYGRGVRGWNYKGNKTFQHYINPYTEKNYYFFTITQGPGKQMDTLSASAVSPSALQPTSFQEKFFVEEEKYNLQNSGRRWVGELFSGTDAGTYAQPLPGLVASSSITYIFKFLHQSTSFDDYLQVFENGQILSGGRVGMGATSMGSYFADEIYFPASRTGGVPNNASVVKIQVNSSNPDAKTWLDWMEIYYQRKFEAASDALIFTSPDVAGSVHYDINNFSSDIRAFDVTDHNNVRELKYYSADPTVCTIQLQQTGGSVREIAVVGKAGFKIPAAATKIENTINLHNVQSQYDFIIISPQEFLSEASRLKTHRESRDSLRTLVVDINQIYNEFSGGLPDVLAIREFLRYTQENWKSPVPQYVLLFGWGHYDYKNISTNQRNWIPPYETNENYVLDDSYPTDDKFVLLGLNSLYSIAIGRLPARSIQEASVTVNKIISYETTAPADSWRNSLTFVADDGKTSGTEDDGADFTNPTEDLAESAIAKSFEKNKIYIVEYPTVISASGRRKPDANKAIDDAINQGTLFINYIGHGNEQLWAHEYIFTQDGDLPKLFNRDRLTFVVAATCSFGKYDNPNILSGGEQLVTMEQGGAIGSLVTSRTVTNESNIYFNDYLFSYLFTKDGTGRNPRLGDAVRYGKSNAYSIDPANTQKFHLFGDPTLRLLMPKNVSSVDSINGISTSSIVTIKSLAHVPIQGAMKLNNGTPMTTFQGKGILQVLDSQREMVIVDGDNPMHDTFRFKANGSLLYRGGVSINSGKFGMTIPIPKDVTFGNQSRISMYAWNDATDGAGYTENVMISGIDSTAADTVGPQILIYIKDLNFRSGDVVKGNDSMIVRLIDESGINTSTAGVGHQLLATISNPVQTFNLSNNYQSDFNTYKSGEVRYPLPDLSEGKYTLRVKAWDIYNNSSEAETYFEVSAADDLTMLNVVNYPNPFANSTTFTFQRNVIDPINVEIKIFSIAGRLIGKISVQNITDRSVRIPWDGRDHDGDNLANGIYLYKLIAHSQNGQHSSETIGKLAIVR
jgi:Peptidase family C25